MKIGVFISWSGEPSKSIAKILSDWLPLMLNSVNPYFSPRDIKKGSLWRSELSKTLGELKIGLLIMTPNNLESNWIMYEAGALAKDLDTSKVVPILFDVKPVDLKGPLSQFQASIFNKDDIKGTIEMINDELNDNKLSANHLNISFENWYPILKKNVEDALNKHSKSVSVKEKKSMIETRAEYVLKRLRGTWKATPNSVKRDGVHDPSYNNFTVTFAGSLNAERTNIKPNSPYNTNDNTNAFPSGIWSLCEKDKYAIVRENGIKMNIITLNDTDLTISFKIDNPVELKGFWIFDLTKVIVDKLKNPTKDGL